MQKQPPDDLFADLRQSERIQVQIEVNLAGASITARTRDLSAGGMFVEWQDPLEAGSLLPVTLQLSTGPLEMTAVIVRSVDGVGMGMRFGSQSQVALKRLAGFLEDQAG